MKTAVALYDHLRDIARIEAASYHPELVTSISGFTKILESTGELGELVVALSKNGGVLGFAHYSLVEPRVLTLHDLAVDPAKRGKGIGRMLLKRVLRTAADRKRRLVRLHVPQENIAALSLYLRHGFKAVSKLEKYYPGKRDGWVLEKKL